MSYWQALDKAKSLARAGEVNSEKPISVAEAINSYLTDLETHGGRKYNATQLHLHVTDVLKGKKKRLAYVIKPNCFHLGRLARTCYERPDRQKLART